MTGAFPDLAASVMDLPPGTVLDGEIVAWVEGRLDFDALQQRLSSGAKRRPSLVRMLPASLVIFDVLALDGSDVRHKPFEERRRGLEHLAADWRPPLELSPVTDDPAIAAEWFEHMTAAGIEGLVVKGASQPYVPGERQWVKVKHHRTLDVVIGAVIGPIQQPEVVVVGFPDDDDLRIVGRSTPLRPAAARALGTLLLPATSPHPWPEVVSPGAVDRFNAGRDPVRLTLVEPMLAEVSADVALTRGAFRHGVRFLRVRDDLTVPARWSRSTGT